MSEWISVKDRLPEENSDVLVSGIDYGEGSSRHYCVAMRGGSDTFYLHDDEDGYYEELTHITHWMPLPESPKQC